MTHECVCKTCGREFNSQRTDSEICYGCALTRITGGRPPEEGDFNSAHLISGEMSDKEWGWLQEDLRSVEEGRPIVEPYENEQETAWREQYGDQLDWWDAEDREEDE